MRLSSVQFTELRRGLPVIAAALLILALFLPMWRITLTAPQYPGQTLLLELYAYPKMTGDVTEINGLNKYVGFHYPDPVYVEPNFPTHETSIKVPEWILGPVAFVVVALTGVFVAIAPTVRKLRLGLTFQLLGAVLVFSSMFAIIQFRLYQAGHSLDPNAPLTGIAGFTPPVLGPYSVANITGFAWFGLGGYLTLLAIVLLGASYLLRDSEVRFSDTPRIIQGHLSDMHSKRGQRSTTSEEEIV